ncbi:MAG: hypothetical protein K6T87_12035 [Roseiflexus sp.]|uniref:hypothetical protein n=1 Tax=Roseiflexus sp. TaxID=2562120 RepID=UPI0025DAE567|nr:hypothetical protein [Roseiflexus sp.]MCL6541287.1 hypothetical protein [Roseiflexus sp.]
MGRSPCARYRWHAIWYKRLYHEEARDPRIHPLRQTADLCRCQLPLGDRHIRRARPTVNRRADPTKGADAPSPPDAPGRSAGRMHAPDPRARPTVNRRADPTKGAAPSPQHTGRSAGRRMPAASPAPAGLRALSADVHVRAGVARPDGCACGGTSPAAPPDAQASG